MSQLASLTKVAEGIAESSEPLQAAAMLLAEAGSHEGFPSSLSVQN